MGFLKKIGKAVSNTVKGVTKAVSYVTDPITNFAGDLVNNVTGVTGSARQQIKAQEQLQQMAQNFNAEQANIERNWQEEMSNSARQRAVEDSQKAGINPILAAGGTAAGASAGAGAAATSSTGQAGTGTGNNPISMITELIKASNNTAKTNAEIKNINADTNLKKQTHDNGGNGGTGVTRTIDWIGNKINKTGTSARKNIKEAEEKGFNPFNKNSYWYKN